MSERLCYEHLEAKMWYKLEKQVSIMREALERIAYMDNGVFSKGLYCSKIAKDALQKAGC